MNVTKLLLGFDTVSGGNITASDRSLITIWSRVTTSSNFIPLTIPSVAKQLGADWPSRWCLHRLQAPHLIIQELLHSPQVVCCTVVAVSWIGMPGRTDQKVPLDWNPPFSSLPEALALAEILGDPHSKKSPLPSIGTSPCLAASPKDTSYRVLGQSRIHHRHTTLNNHTRLLAQ